MVEDEREIAELMALHLRREGHEVTCVEDGEQAIRTLSSESEYALLILDWMLPGVSGLELCKKIRAEKGTHGVPILMVTARAHTSDIVLGLEMGADDYLTKPFEVPVFLARVRALLRRSSALDNSEDRLFTIDDLSVDLDAYRVTCHKKELSLTPSEFKLLVALVKSQGRVLTRERLIDLVQGEGVTVVDRAIDTHIFGLRKKLGKCADVVETIRGVGYRVKI
ncbi:response regulator transcription factor [bacterium]|nr:response regulator transcription factor [bacterium]